MDITELPQVLEQNETIADRKRHPAQWIWDGFIAGDCVTLLSAPEKTGKSTLLSLLLDRRRQGGQLLGRAVRPGRTIVCSEEDEGIWALREPPLDFGGRVQFCRTEPGPPSRRSWHRWVDHVIGLRWTNDDIDLIVIDTVLSFLPPARRNPHSLRRSLDDVRQIAREGAAVLLLHQSRTASRPLKAFADILIDLERPLGDRFTRRRSFTGVGRPAGVLQHVAAELNADGTDYLVLPDAASAAEPALGRGLETLRRFLNESPEPLTRQEIIARWPPGEPPPHTDSLWRILARGCALGVFARSGAGTRTAAFRYAVAT